MATRMNTSVSRPAFVRLAAGSYSALCRKLEPRYAIAPVSTRKFPTVWPWSNAYGRTARKNAATNPPRPNHTTSTATRNTSNSDNAYTSHQRYQPRSWMRPRSSFTNAAPPATSTMAVGRVLTAPNSHPTSPRANPNPTLTPRRRRVAGGEHAVRDHDGDTGLERAFDTPTRAVPFRVLADREGVERLPLGPGGGGNGVGDGIGAEGQPADQVGRPPWSGETCEPEGADHEQAFARHGGAARIDVETGAAPGREEKIPVRDRAVPQQRAQASL